MLWRFLVSLCKMVLQALFRSVVGSLAKPFIGRILQLRHLAAMSPSTREMLLQWFKATMLLLVASSNIEPLIKVRLGVQQSHANDSVFLIVRMMTVFKAIQPMAAASRCVLTSLTPSIPSEAVSFRDRIASWAQKHGKCLIFQHLNTTSPALAVMSAVIPGAIGWVALIVSILQYLIIGIIDVRSEAMEIESDE